MKNDQAKGPYRIEIVPRPSEIGGGWRLQGYEIVGSEEIEVHRKIFNDDHKDARQAAVDAGEAWLAAQTKPEHRDAEHYMLGCFSRDAAARVGE